VKLNTYNIPVRDCGSEGLQDEDGGALLPVIDIRIHGRVKWNHDGFRDALMKKKWYNGGNHSELCDAAFERVSRMYVLTAKFQWNNTRITMPWFIEATRTFYKGEIVQTGRGGGRLVLVGCRDVRKWNKAQCESWIKYKKRMEKLCDKLCKLEATLESARELYLR
jgi:hypothetical protein